MPAPNGGLLVLALLLSWVLVPVAAANKLVNSELEQAAYATAGPELESELKGVPMQLARRNCLDMTAYLAQLTGVMVPFEDLQYLDTAAAEGHLGLVGLLGDPDSSLAPSLARLQRLSPIPILVGSDEESRSVQRLASVIYRLPTTRRMVANGVPFVHDLFSDYARQMRELGVHISFGPVADVGRGPGIGYRSFGEDADVVAEFAAATVDGVIAGQGYPVVKHFPGHGKASADTHHLLATTPPLSKLASQLMVFRELLTRDVAVMVGHLVVPDLTDGKPASLSHSAITGLLRESLDFDGVVISDSLDMAAISDHRSQAEAGLQAILAGTDIALASSLAQQQNLLRRLQAAYKDGRLSPQRIEQSVTRVLRLKNKIFEPRPPLGFQPSTLARCDG